MWDEFLYGVCYYPEHWHSSRHAGDIARMAECGFNVIRMGEGAWNYWEPEEGKYQFELFDRVIDLCRDHGIRVILGTPTYVAPAWVSHKYPEVLRWNFNRIPMAHGSRRNLNYTSPKYLELSDKICTALAEHYRDDEQVIAWQLDNEFNCHMDVSYAPSDTSAFRAWLKEKYKKIDALNHAWGTAFWSQTYGDWCEIDLPRPTATYHNPTQLLDEMRFVSDCVVRFARRQAEILRKHQPRWKITHNGLFSNVNGRELAKALDFFSHDQYPLFWKEWTGCAYPLQTARSISMPFAIMEQQSGPGGQMAYLQRTPLPGEMKLWAWQSILHGARALCYFRWRTCPYGSEQHWHGLLDADDRDNRRIEEAGALDEEIRSLPREFFEAPMVRAVAVMRDFDNEANDRRINTYNKGGQWEHHRWMAEFGRRHVPADIVWPDSDLSGYRILIAPHLKIIDEALALKYRAFVESGGTLILGAQSGLKNRHCHVVEMTPPGLLRQLAGVEVEEFTTLEENELRVARMEDGRLLELTTYVEGLRLLSAEPIGHWMDDALLGSSPAVTKNRVGKGLVYYVGGYCPDSAVAKLAQTLHAPIVHASSEVEVVARQDDHARYLGLINHGRSAQRVTGLGSAKELISDTPVPEEGLVLSSFGVAVIQQGLKD